MSQHDYVHVQFTAYLFLIEMECFICEVLINILT